MRQALRLERKSGLVHTGCEVIISVQVWLQACGTLGAPALRRCATSQRTLRRCCGEDAMRGAFVQCETGRRKHRRGWLEPGL